MAGMRIFWRGCRSCQVFGTIEDTLGGDCFEVTALKEIDWFHSCTYDDDDDINIYIEMLPVG